MNMIIQQLNILTLIGLILAIIHFGTPLAYYYHAKRRWLHKPWNIKTNPNYKPKTTIIIPTYNEAKLIEKKLDNIYQQDYPRSMLEVIVVDSASDDGTPEKVKDWTRKHPDLNLKLIQEPERKGKAHALNNALKHAIGEIVITTDVDAWWPSSNTLSETAKWLADPTIGAVSCLKKPATPSKAGIEEEYRKYYNTLRLAESKAWSTPIFHGELAAFKTELLKKLGGFPINIGADDSHTATRIALTGYRAIIPENILCIEIVPRNGYHAWRIRRAQHLIQHFIKTLTIKPKTPRPFKPILYVEAFLHLVNPWILLVITLLFLIISITKGSLLATTMLTLGVFLLTYESYRTWVTTQMYLIAATLRNLYNKELTWVKNAKAEAILMHIK